MEKIIILDFGSQYTQLIARKIRELNVYSEIIPFHAPIEITHNVKGIILSGSPYSVIDKDAPQPNLSSVQGKLPILGICYGAQLLAQYGGGTITAAKTREYGRANLKYVDTESPLFSYIKPNSQVWMSHADTISELPSHFSIIASTHNVNIAAYHLQGENTYGIQFHPEVYHSTDGMQLLENFIVTICGCSQNWTPQSFIEATINDLQQKIGNDKVVLGLSGGVDSSVAAVLLHKAIGTALTCIFVDNGVLRKNEFESVLEQYKVLGLNVIGVNAKDTFLDKLQGVSEPEKKR
ncbi:MAG TPA: glutamine-hydrolyzing GMP synthase, partial [Bacteroidales bacterium]|nr:glutamine-hydrolyzing GMP synthase [Bacteroidales bacterium]